MRQGYLVVFFCFLTVASFSQSGSTQIESEQTEDSVARRSNYLHDSVRNKFIKSYPDHFFIWPVIKQRSLTVETRSIQDPNHRVFFRPNNSVSMGLGFYVLEVAFELAFAVPIEEQSRFRYGTSSASDLQINALGKFWGFDLYRQKYTGLYIDDSFQDIAPDEPFPQRPDIIARNFGLAGIYTFNRDKFSIRSSFNFSEQQLYSRGSWFVTGTLNSFRMQGDSILLSIPNREQFSEFSDFNFIRYATLGVAPGYSHNFIYKNFFLNLTVGLGPAHNWTYIKEANGTERNSISINTISVARIGIGYNADHFFAGIGFVNQSRNLKVEDIRVANSSTSLKMIVGFRFKEFGFLKKRAVDFIPFKI